jgi:predicted DNA-binding protein (MmcQ/YjbR family)
MPGLDARTLDSYCLAKPGAWADNPWDHEHPVIKVAGYIGRSGWTTLAVGGGIPDDEIREAVDESYDLVVAQLLRRHRPPGWER